ncbi:hypothetical protein ACQZ4O_28185, partial [Agrobacterium vitis]|uniref:hypothetical protein n=1 Tax=Allorhizobium ampelinum TaxID=3025782 RepID=UPI001F463486
LIKGWSDILDSKMAASGKTKPASRRVAVSGNMTCLTHHSMNGDNNQSESANKFHGTSLSPASATDK